MGRLDLFFMEENMDNLYINIERLFLIFYNDIGGQFYSVHLGFLCVVTSMSFSHHESTLDMDNNSQEVRKAVTVEAVQNVAVSPSAAAVCIDGMFYIYVCR
jgi:zona occludens toxin (predicted ATPase)